MEESIEMPEEVGAPGPHAGETMPETPAGAQADPHHLLIPGLIAQAGAEPHGLRRTHSKWQDHSLGDVVSAMGRALWDVLEGTERGGRDLVRVSLTVGFDATNGAGGPAAECFARALEEVGDACSTSGFAPRKAVRALPWCSGESRGAIQPLFRNVGDW